MLIEADYPQLAGFQEALLLLLLLALFLVLLLCMWCTCLVAQLSCLTKQWVERLVSTCSERKQHGKGGSVGGREVLTGRGSWRGFKQPAEHSCALITAHPESEGDQKQSEDCEKMIDRFVVHKTCLRLFSAKHLRLSVFYRRATTAHLYWNEIRSFCIDMLQHWNCSKCKGLLHTNSIPVTGGVVSFVSLHQKVLEL